jgi:hypothetical protein
MATRRPRENLWGGEKKEDENSGKKPKRETGVKKQNRKPAVNCTKV